MASLSIKDFLKRVTDEVTDFYDKGIPEVGCNHTCLAVISLDSALEKDEDYYPQVFLKEFKYIEEKMINEPCLQFIKIPEKLYNKLFKFCFNKRLPVYNKRL